MRIVEWFSGIGGCRAASPPGSDVVAAVDHDEQASRVYGLWWGEPSIRRNIAHLRPAQVPSADLWWMSPPCQPYTIRGQQKDLEDRRSAAFLRLVDLLGDARPRHLALENVPWFEGSQGHTHLVAKLDGLGYHVDSGMLCPTQLGIPMVRRRFFLVASLDPVRFPTPAVRPRALRDYVDVDVAGTDVDPRVLERFADALHVVDPDDDDAVAACFTGAYGNSPVYAGSYLRSDRHPGGVRRFDPHEILRLMGFPSHCVLPPDLTAKKAMKLVGNSVSVDCVRLVLSAFTESGGASP